MVGLHVRQLLFQTDLEGVLPLMIDEHSMVCDFVRPDSVPVVQAYMSTDVCGDDRFSPGVTDYTSLGRQNELDSHGEEPWKCLSVAGYSSVECSAFGCTFVGLAGISGYGRPGLLFEDADHKWTLVMSEGTVPWILVLGRCAPGLGCLNLV